jgi:hypothetical protein
VHELTLLSSAYQDALEAHRQHPEDDDLREARDRAKDALDVAWMDANGELGSVL